jgi:ribose transport system ATP-binding protein
MPSGEILLECIGLGKSFSGVRVLENVSFTAARGDALGVVGENGAGKSTLMNLVGGIHRPNAGVMRFDGEPYAPATALDATRAGIAFVHQELNLFGNLSVADNVFLTAYPTRWGRIDRERTRRRTSELLARLELDIPPDTLVETLTQGERQLVEIAKALHIDARLIILDEPTTSLSSAETSRLFATLERLRESGIALIYISHTLDDVRRLCDRVLVLRDGRAVASGATDDFPASRMISLMIGRPVEQLFPPFAGTDPGPIALAAREVSQPGIVEKVTFELHSGEVLGIAGLMGSGRTELARILFGVDAHASGEILLDGDPLRGSGPRERIRRGMAFVTDSRRDDGLFIDAPVAPNMEIVHPEPRRIPEVAAALRISAANLDRQPVRELSGGNQQKVALGKWLVRPPRVFLLDEPTRGIDVGAKYEIYRLIGQLAADGVAVLVISSEIEELIGICHRILVMRKGEIAAAFGRPFDRERILGAAL